METKSRCLLLVVTGAFTGISNAGDTQQQVSTGEFLTRMMTDVTKPTIEYCAQSAPSTQPALNAEYGKFISKVSKAVAPLIATGPKTMPVSAGFNMNDFVIKLGKIQLEGVQKYDPVVYCSWLVTSLHSTTVKGLKAKVESTYHMYMSLAEQKADSPGGH